MIDMAQRALDGAVRRVLRSEASRLVSALPQPLQDLLDGMNPDSRGADPLDRKRFEITSLNDVMLSAQAQVADATCGHHQGRKIRNTAREQRLRAWSSFLSELEETRRREVADAINQYEKKESARISRFADSMDRFRAKVASKDSNTKKGFNLGKWFGNSPEKELTKLISEQVEHERVLLETLRMIGVDVKGTVNNLLKGHQSALALAKDWEDLPRSKTAYVIDYKGDMKASQNDALKDEISAIICLPESQKPAEVIVRLDSQGGQVHGYGLAESELCRIKRKGIKLTVCVDGVAASGGYMMACVADHIICSPWAMLGSIGVLNGMPNAAEFMHRQGLKFYKLTAGKNKNNLDPFTVPTEEGLAHMKSQMERILEAFANHVADHRSDRLKKDISAIAQGDVWMGAEALELGLVDEIRTSEDYLLHRMQSDNVDVYQIKKIKEKKGQAWGANPRGSSSSASSTMDSGADSLLMMTMAGRMPTLGSDIVRETI